MLVKFRCIHWGYPWIILTAVGTTQATVHNAILYTRQLDVIIMLIQLGSK
jgi:hypothetical protein